MEEKREDMSMEDIIKNIDEIKGDVGDIVSARVISKVEDGLVVDFGGKFEGFIPFKELVKDPSEYSEGDEIEARIYRIDEDEGRAYLSERRPRFAQVMSRIREAYAGDRIVRGRIVGEIKGGYRVLIDGVVEAFLPGSHSLLRRGDGIPQEEMEFEIISFEEGRRRPNIVLSRKTILEKKIEEFFSSVKEGDIVEGKVEAVQAFGVFVRLAEGVTGLLPRSEVSYGRVANLADMFKEGDELRLKVIAVKPDEKKITLSLKAMMPDPFEEFKKEYGVGSRVSGEVLRIRADGFTMRLPHDLVGFVPIEEIFWSRRGRIRDLVREGDVVEAEVVEIDDERRRIVLSYKRAKGDPWEKVEEKYPVGSEHEGRVVRVLQTGAIVELEDGVSGFVPLSELSWYYFETPDEVIRERRRVKVKILDINKDEKRMRLSVKQAQKNPWDKVLQEVERGSVVRGRVRRIAGNDYVVRIKGYNVDAFLPRDKVEEELKIGSEVEAVVIRIANDRKMGKRMVISVKDLEEIKAVQEYKKEAQGIGKTLGDILKEKLEKGE